MQRRSLLRAAAQRALVVHEQQQQRIVRQLALERPFDGATFASLMMKIARGNVANTAALDASGHPAPLRWLASKDALLHPDADERMTIPALIEHCAIESLARASAREVGSGGRGGGSIMSAVV